MAGEWPAVMLVLQSSRPRSTGLAYLFGWLSGLVALTVLFVEVPRLLGDLDAPAPRWISWARLVIGVRLLIAGVW